MKPAFVLIVGLSLINNVKTLACTTLESDTLAPISQTQANELMSTALYGENTPVSNIETTVKQIDCNLEKIAARAPSLNNVRQAFGNLGQAAIGAETLEQKRAVIGSINSLITRDAGSGFVQLPTSMQQSVQVNLYSQFIDANCNDEQTLNCAQNTKAAIDLWRIAGDFRSFANILNSDDKSSSLTFLENIDTQWRSYKDDTVKLWPQEVLLNSVVYTPSERGLSSPPSYKLLALRPALGLSYLSDQSHRIQPTINVDLLGIYWWKYGANNRAQAGRGISASLIWDGDDTAYGLSYHHNPKWSLTIANGDENDVVVSISFQLAHWLLKR